MPGLYSLYQVLIPPPEASKVVSLCFIGESAHLSFLNGLQPAAFADQSILFEPISPVPVLDIPTTSPNFYTALAQALKLPPASPYSHSSILVLSTDLHHVLTPANKAGFKTIWIDSGNMSQVSPVPVQVGEILRLDELPALLAKQLNPRLEDCDALITSFALPPNIIRHMQAVSQFAYTLARRLKRVGIPLDPILVHRAAYLHDLDKLQSLQEGNRARRDLKSPWRMQNSLEFCHGQSAARTISAWGHPAIAQIVEAHVLERILDHPASLTSWEAKIVYYADKCFGGDQRISVQERCQRLTQRYPNAAAQIQQALPLILNLEQELIHLIGHL